MKQAKHFFLEDESPTSNGNSPYEVFYYQSRKYVIVMIGGKIILAIWKWILVKQRTVFSIFFFIYFFFFSWLIDFSYYDFCITCTSIFSCIKGNTGVEKPTLRCIDELSSAIFRINLGDAILL